MVIKKLKPRKLGPFKVISKRNPVSYKFDLPKKKSHLLFFI